jgi:hypothetical protein
MRRDFVVILPLLLACLFLGTDALLPSRGSADLGRVLLDTDAVQAGARCLDGSPPGYYYREGSGSGANSYLLFIDGGGWCSSPEDCYDRSNTFLGSSTSWPPTKPVDRPIFSADPQVNPDFWNWNIINFAYCDGASFSGNRRDPIVVRGKELFFRGHLVLEHLMKNLLQQTDVGNASQVMLSGCSAGGVATILYADYIKSFFGENKNLDFKSVSFSGFFPDAPSYENGLDVLSTLVRDVYAMQNVSSSLSPQCMEDQERDPHLCFMSQYSYLYVKSPIYLVNSVYDAWTVENIYNITAKRWEEATDEGSRASMVEYLNERANVTYDLITRAPTWSQKSNGGFLSTCLTHCGGCCSDQGWDKTLVDGKTLRDSLRDWFFERTTTTTSTSMAQSSSGTTTSSLPCQWSTSPPYLCNPTCTSTVGESPFAAFLGEVGQQIGEIFVTGIQNLTSNWLG